MRPKPVAICLIENAFTLIRLCVSCSQEYIKTNLRSIEFAFYVNREGRRSRENVLVHWEGAPMSFGGSYLKFAPATHLMDRTITSHPIPIRTSIRA